MSHKKRNLAEIEQEILSELNQDFLSLDPIINN